MGLLPGAESDCRCVCIHPALHSMEPCPFSTLQNQQWTGACCHNELAVGNSSRCFLRPAGSLRPAYFSCSARLTTLLQEHVCCIYRGSAAAS